MNRLIRNILVVLLVCICQITAYGQIDVNTDINQMVIDAQQQQTKTNKKGKKQKKNKQQKQQQQLQHAQA